MVSELTHTCVCLKLCTFAYLTCSAVLCDVWYSWFLQVTNVRLLTCRTCGLSSGCGSIRAAGLLYLCHPCVGCRERHFQGKECHGDCRPFPCGELSWLISGRKVLTSKRRPSCPAMLSPIGFQTGGNGAK